MELYYEMFKTVSGLRVVVIKSTLRFSQYIIPWEDKTTLKKAEVREKSIPK